MEYAHPVKKDTSSTRAGVTILAKYQVASFAKLQEALKGYVKIAKLATSRIQRQLLPLTPVSRAATQPESQLVVVAALRLIRA